MMRWYAADSWCIVSVIIICLCRSYSAAVRDKRKAARPLRVSFLLIVAVEINCAILRHPWIIMSVCLWDMNSLKRFNLQNRVYRLFVLRCYIYSCQVSFLYGDVKILLGGVRLHSLKWSIIKCVSQNVFNSSNVTSSRLRETLSHEHSFFCSGQFLFLWH